MSSTWLQARRREAVEDDGPRIATRGPSVARHRPHTASAASSGAGRGGVAEGHGVVAAAIDAALMRAGLIR